MHPIARAILSIRNSTIEKPTITLHVASSLDGFIANNDNSVSWLEGSEDSYEAGTVLEDSDIESVLASIDCYVLGYRTYEHALQLGWPYGDTPAVVLSRQERESTMPNVEFYSGDLQELVSTVLVPRFKSAWLVGGAMLCQRFLELDLIDRIILTIAPVTLGGGLRLFGSEDIERRWKLADVVAYKNGFVELTYEAASSRAAA